MIKPYSVKMLLRRIARATTRPKLQQVIDDMGDTYAVLSEIKTAILVKRKGFTK